MSALKGANAALMFLLEMAGYAAAGYWAWTTHDGALAQWGWTVAVLAVLVGAWALWGAPTASWPAHGGSRILLEVCWFGCGALALVLAGLAAWAAAFVALFLVNLGLRARAGQLP